MFNFFILSAISRIVEKFFYFNEKKNTNNFHSDSTADFAINSLKIVEKLDKDVDEIIFSK